MPRMRLRHLMLVVLYVAVILGLMMPAIRTPWPNRIQLLVPTALGVPIAMALLSALILRPGPHRNWATTFFLVVAQSLCGFLVLAGMLSGELIPKQLGGPWDGPLIWVILVLVAIASWFLVIALTQQFLIPRRCPRCTKTTLLQSGLFVDRTRRSYRKENHLSMLEWLVHQDSQQFSFFRCSVCDSEVFLDHCRARLGCPTCSRTALYFLRRTKNGDAAPITAPLHFLLVSFLRRAVQAALTRSLGKRGEPRRRW